MQTVALLLLACTVPVRAFVVGPAPLRSALPTCAVQRVVSPAQCALEPSLGDEQFSTAAAQDGMATAAPLGWWRRTVRRVLTGVAIGGASVMMRRPAAMPQAHAVTAAAQKKMTPAKRPKPRSSSGSTALTTVSLFGGMAFIAYRQAAAEDEEELVRIKEENEKMKKMSKEFTDIDEAVTVDADLMASLQRRIAKNATKTDGDSDGPIADAGDGDSPPPTPDGSDDSGGGAAVLERPSASGGSGDDAAAPPAPPEPSTASAEQADYLKRLFDQPDADK